MGELPTNVSPKWLIEMSDASTKPRLVDVRKRPAFESSGRMISGAVWRDHETVEKWGKALASEKQLIVYCVHGHEVSQNAVAVLVSMGIEARYLQGGFEAWLEAGGDVIEVAGNAGPEGE